MVIVGNSNIPSSSFFNANDLRGKAILAGKVAAVALTVLALLAGACFTGSLAFPLFASTELTFAKGLLGAAFGIGVGGLLLPLWGMNRSCTPITPMYETTEHNLKDIGVFLAKGVAAGVAGAIGGVLVSPILPFAVTCAGVCIAGAYLDQTRA